MGMSTFGLPFEVGFAGRAIEQMSRLSRMNQVIPTILEAKMDHYQSMLQKERRENIIDISVRKSEQDPEGEVGPYDLLNAAELKAKVKNKEAPLENTYEVESD
jgi:ATP-dependent protease HslVU (ClpYQ) ATPase subunit